MYYIKFKLVTCERGINITFLLCCHLCEMSITPWPKPYNVQRNFQIHTYVCIFVFLFKIFLFLKGVFPYRYENLCKRMEGKCASWTKMFCILCYLINHGWLDVFYRISRSHLQERLVKYKIMHCTEITKLITRTKNYSWPGTKDWKDITSSRC